MTQQLSPAAKAVLDASVSVFWRPVIDVPALHHKSVAAALRAVADQSENLYDPHEGKVSVVRVEHLRAIATELEAQ